MTNPPNYVIQGGEAGKSRLNILAAVMEPYTKSLLQTLGVKQGMAFIDNGTGGGHVAIMAAGMVGAHGRVVATDADASILELAAKEAAVDGIHNVEFIHTDIAGYQYHNEFDIAYARFLLSHLGDPAMGLQKMIMAVKPGGMVVVEDLHFSGHFCHPPNAAFQRYLHWYAAVVQRRHGNAEIGPSLPGLLKQAGLSHIAFDVVQPAFSTGQGKWMAYVTLDRVKDGLVKEGIAGEDEIGRTLDELKAFTEDEQSIISLPRVFRVWGMKGI